MKKISRHKNRRWALQILYGLDVKERLNPEEAQQEFDNIIDKYNLEAANTDFYFKRLVIGVITNREQLDQLINDRAIDWEIDRMAYIDRNILRIAVQEIENEQIPRGVAINEAVELAKEFGSGESSRFINGILAKI